MLQLSPATSHDTRLAKLALTQFHMDIIKTVWPSGLRRWLKAPVRKGVGSNPTAVIIIPCALICPTIHCNDSPSLSAAGFHVIASGSAQEII